MQTARHGILFREPYWQPVNRRTISEGAGFRNIAFLERAVPIPPIDDDITAGGTPDLAKKVTAAIRRAPIIDSLALVMETPHWRTEPRNGVADRLAAIGVELKDVSRIAEAAQNACERGQRDDLCNLMQLILLFPEPRS